jgi:hypothetical protein
MSEEENDTTGDGGLTEAMTGGEDFLVDQPAKKGSNPMLVATLLLALAGGAAYWFYFKPQPSGASASVSGTAAAGSVDAKKTIDEFLSSGGKDLAAMEQMLRNTEQVVRQFLAYPTMTQVPLKDLSTNPFRFKAPEPETPSAVDVRKQRDELRQRAIKSVSSLRVESIMTGGGGGTAIINGVVVRPGDSVEGFRIEEIKVASVVVRDENFRFELRLSQ